MTCDDHNSRGLLAELIGDGRSLITFTGLILGLCGLFALFLSATKHFLPHDVEFLGMTPPDLCSINECRIVHFMIHDRVSFGGALIAIAILYLWLAAFPLRMGQAWAWWLLVISGGMGFGSFLLYLGYGYLDTWHGVATLGCCHVSWRASGNRIRFQDATREFVRYSAPASDRRGNQVSASVVVYC